MEWTYRQEEQEVNTEQIVIHVLIGLLLFGRLFFWEKKEMKTEPRDRR